MSNTRWFPLLKYKDLLLFIKLFKLFKFWTVIWTNTLFEFRETVMCI